MPYFHFVSATKFTVCETKGKSSHGPSRKGDLLCARLKKRQEPLAGKDISRPLTREMAVAKCSAKSVWWSSAKGKNINGQILFWRTLWNYESDELRILPSFQIEQILKNINKKYCVTSYVFKLQTVTRNVIYKHASLTFIRVGQKNNLASIHSHTSLSLHRAHYFFNVFGV